MHGQRAIYILSTFDSPSSILSFCNVVVEWPADASLRIAIASTSILLMLLAHMVCRFCMRWSI